MVAPFVGFAYNGLIIAKTVRGIYEERAMSQLIRLIGRGAFVALGLTAGFQAQAASVTIDAGAACVGFTWNGSTLSCTVDTACVVSGPSTGTPGQDVVLTASCPTSTTINWTGTGTCVSTTSNTCTANEASAVGNRTYIATGNQSAASPAKTVNWTNSAVAPNCSLSASPSSGGPAAANVTLTLTCSTGTTPYTLAWSGSGTSGNCPTAMAGTSTTCTISNVSATTTWGVAVTGPGGNDNSNNATYTYNAGGGGSFANCPGGSETYAHTWGGAGEQYTSQGFGDNIQSIRFVIPVGTTVSSSKLISVVEYADPPTYREMVISTVACSFDDATLLRNSFGYHARSWGQSPGMNYRTSNGSTYFQITPGVPVFINIRNRNEAGQSTCTSSCNTRTTIRD